MIEIKTSEHQMFWFLDLSGGLFKHGNIEHVGTGTFVPTISGLLRLTQGGFEYEPLPSQLQKECSVDDLGVEKC